MKQIDPRLQKELSKSLGNAYKKKATENATKLMNVVTEMFIYSPDLIEKTHLVNCLEIIMQYLENTPKKERNEDITRFIALLQRT